MFDCGGVALSEERLNLDWERDKSDLGRIAGQPEVIRFNGHAAPWRRFFRCSFAGFAWVILSLTGELVPQYHDKVDTYSQPAHAHPSFRTERADFFFPLRSCEAVGLRREKSLFLFRRLFGEIAFMLWLVIKGARAVPTI